MSALAEIPGIHYHGSIQKQSCRARNEVEHASPSDRDADEEIKRESIWSVKEEDRPKFSHYFTILFSIGLAFSVWYEIFYVVDDSIFDTVIALMRDIGLTGIAAVVLTFARFEGGDSMGVALDIYRKLQYEKGHAEGREEGLAEGRAEGRAENHAEIEALRRRVAELERRNGNSSDV